MTAMVFVRSRYPPRWCERGFQDFIFAGNGLVGTAVLLPVSVEAPANLEKFHENVWNRGGAGEERRPPNCFKVAGAGAGAAARRREL